MTPFDGLAEIVGHLVQGLVLACEDIQVGLVLARQAETLADQLLHGMVDLVRILLHVLQQLAEDFVVRLPAVVKPGQNIVQQVEQLADLLVLMMEAIKYLRHGS